MQSGGLLHCNTPANTNKNNIMTYVGKGVRYIYIYIYIKTILSFNLLTLVIISSCLAELRFSFKLFEHLDMTQLEIYMSIADWARRFRRNCSLIICLPKVNHGIPSIYLL